jgi:hypothetical protein
VTAPDGPAARDLAIQEAAAAICPANHRRGGDPKEPPCGVCYATAESAINAYVAHLVQRSHYGTLGVAPGWLTDIDPPAAGQPGGDDTEEGR